MWQKHFEKYGSDSFTVVAIAMDVEGVDPAKRYYEKHGVTFHALVDPNYATRFAYVPWTFFVDEHGVVQNNRNWQSKIKNRSQLKQVTPDIRRKFAPPADRLSAGAISLLVKRLEKAPADVAAAAELGSRYLLLSQHESAKRVLSSAIGHFDPQQLARSSDKKTQKSLSDAYLQLSRASRGDRAKQVESATLAYFLNPSVGLGKQIARVIAPEKFDRPDGRFDNAFREGTLKRLRAERKSWLSQ